MIQFQSVPYKKLSCGFGNLDSPIPDLLSLHGKEWDVHLKIHLSCSKEVSFLSGSIQNKLQVAHNTKYNDFHSVRFSAIYSFLFYPSVAFYPRRTVTLHVASAGLWRGSTQTGQLLDISSFFCVWSTMAEFDTQREKRREQKEMACLILTGKLISNP